MNALHLERRLQAGPGSSLIGLVSQTNTWLAALVFACAVGLFVVLRLWHLTDLSLSFDEIFSVHAVRHDWAGLIDFVRRDLVHPPLFYVLLKVWVMLVGESLLALRLFSTLLAIVSIFPLLQLFRELNLHVNERNSALVLIAGNSFLIYYSQLLRMYSLLLLLGLCSLWLFVKLYKSLAPQPALMLGLTLINLLLVYTHYFGWILIGVELAVLARRPNRKFLLFVASSTVVAIGFSVWIYEVAQVYVNRGLSHNLGWINRPHLTTLAAYFTTINDKPFDFPWSGRVGLVLFGGPIVLAGWQAFVSTRRQNKKQSNHSWLLLIFAFLPVTLVFLASSLPFQSIWLPRGLLFSAVAYLILVGVAANRLRPRWVSMATLALLLSWTVLAGLKTLNWGSENVRMDHWVHQMIQLESPGTERVTVYTLDQHTPYLTWFYLTSENDRRFQVVLVKDSTASRSESYWLTDEMFPAVAVNNVTDLEGRHFWIAFTDEQWKQKDRPQDILRNAGFRVGEGFVGGPRYRRSYLFPVWRS